MIYSTLTKKALSLAFLAHSAQVDKAGLPYILHPLHLAEQMDDEISTTVALLHDVVEDTDYTLEILEDLGFPPFVLQPLALLTHTHGTPYMDYIRKLSHDPVARRVKLADLRHNSDLTRLDVVTDKDRARVKKYKKAIRILEEVNSRDDI